MTTGADLAEWFGVPIAATPADSPADTRRPRAADDFAAIGARLAALRAGCSCLVYRNGDGSVRASETMANCPLHGDEPAREERPSALDAGRWPADPCATIVAAMIAFDEARQRESCLARIECCEALEALCDALSADHAKAAAQDRVDRAYLRLAAVTYLG